MKIKNLLITGASGFLGRYLCLHAEKKWTVHGTYRTHSALADKVIPHHLNFEYPKEIDNLFALSKPDAVIHTAAISDANLCQNEPVMSKKVNVTASVQIARLCAEKRIPCVFTSSDLVFDGKKGNYTENDSTCALSRYAEQKIEAENLMQKEYQDVSICRIPLLYGKALGDNASFLQGMLNTVHEEKPLHLFRDEYRSPALGSDAAQGLLLVLEKKISGYLNLGGPQRVSRYDFGVLLKDIFQLKKAQIISSLQSEIDLPAPRPPDVSLNSSKAFSLGYSPLTPKKGLCAINSLIQKE